MGVGSYFSKKPPFDVTGHGSRYVPMCILNYILYFVTNIRFWAPDVQRQIRCTRSILQVVPSGLRGPHRSRLKVNVKEIHLHFLIQVSELCRERSSLYKFRFLYSFCMYKNLY